MSAHSILSAKKVNKAYKIYNVLWNLFQISIKSLYIIQALLFSSEKVVNRIYKINGFFLSLLLNENRVVYKTALIEVRLYLISKYLQKDTCIVKLKFARTLIFLLFET